MGVVVMSVLMIHCRSQRVSGWKSMGVVVMSVLTIHCRSQRGVWWEVRGCGGDVSVGDTLQVTEGGLVGSPWVWW